MPDRRHFTRALTCWGFVAALLMKSAVPMLASVAASLQGKAVAEVCAVYGVDLSKARGPATAATVAAVGAPAGPHAHHEHAGHGPHAAPAGTDAPVLATDPEASGGKAPAHSPSSGAHGGDHCALSALAFAFAAAAAPIDVPPAASAPALQAGAGDLAVVDPAARWAAQLQHGPPAFS